MTVEGAMDTPAFDAFVESVLVPTLKAGDLVIMDNLSPHKASPALRRIEGTGASTLFLPAYSPDLNPIENMWSKVKEFLRAAKARTEEDLWAAIARAFAAVTPQDAAHWFASSGYNIS